MDTLEQLTDTNTDLTNQLMQQFGSTLTVVAVASLVLTIIVVVMWIVAMWHRRKVQNAILDIQQTLHEMNERDKQRTRPTNNVVLASETDRDKNVQNV